MADKKEVIEKQRRAVTTERDLPQVGGMRRRRTPKIVGEAKGEIGKLQKKALTTAEYLSHSPIVWEFSDEMKCGQIRCQKCKRAGGFALYPMRGKEQINGPLYEDGGCPA